MNDSRPILKLGHSPDPDDAFMWWPLFSLEGKPSALDTGRFRFEPVMEDIETLNQRSHEADLEITAMSAAQYPWVQDRYAITSCGASVGDGYGPKVVSVDPAFTLESLKEPEVVLAIPGERTTAFSILSLVLGGGDFRYEVVPFDEIIPRLLKGEFAAGLIIHEGQLTYGEAGLHRLLDLGVWWKEQTGFLLPLGVNTVRRDLEEIHGEGTLEEISTLLHASVTYALANREASIAYATQFARDMGSDLADQFIEMYVNQWTLDFGDAGREALARFYDTVSEAGLCPACGTLDLVSPASAAASVGI